MSFSDSIEKEQLQAEFDRCFTALMKAEARIKELEADIEYLKSCPNESWECTKEQRRLEKENARLRKVVDAARESSRWLDGIKYELSASVYTLTDDEFEMVFSARDNIDLSLRELDTGACVA